MNSEGVYQQRLERIKKAIAFEPVVNGQWFVSDTRHGTLVHARLNPGGENWGKLVTLIRQQARQPEGQRREDRDQREGHQQPRQQGSPAAQRARLVL